MGDQTIKSATYNPSANLFSTAQQNQLKTPAQMGSVKIETPEFNPNQLRADIYGGIKTAVEQEREDAQKRLNEALAKTGIFRSGINLENQQKLERSSMDALAKGWGETALQVAGLQGDLAKAQAQFDFDINKYNADIQNAFKSKNFDALMYAAAQDQEAINKAQEFNISIKNAYDEIAFKWAASLLDQEIREYAARLDLIAKAQAANAQYGTSGAKTQWNTLAYQYAKP